VATSRFPLCRSRRRAQRRKSFCRLRGECSRAASPSPAQIVFGHIKGKAEKRSEGRHLRCKPDVACGWIAGTLESTHRAGRTRADRGRSQGPDLIRVFPAESPKQGTTRVEWTFYFRRNERQSSRLRSTCVHHGTSEQRRSEREIDYSKHQTSSTGGRWPWAFGLCWGLPNREAPRNRSGGSYHGA